MSLSFKKLFSIFFIILLISAFGLSSLSNNGSEKINRNVIEVGSEKITVNQFNFLYNNFLLNNNQKGSEDVKNAVVKNIVDDLIFINYLKENELINSDESIIEMIKKMPSFLDEKNRFDKEKYLSFFKEENMKVEEFENILKIAMLKAQLFSVLSNSIHGSKKLSLDIFNELEEIKNFSYIRVPQEKLSFNPSDADLKDYYEKNKNKFLKPRTKTINYYYVDKNNISESADVKVKELKAAYERLLAEKNKKTVYTLSAIKSKSESEIVGFYELLKSDNKWDNVFKDNKSVESLGNFTYDDLKKLFDESVVESILFTHQRGYSEVLKIEEEFYLFNLVSNELVPGIDEVGSQLTLELQDKKADEIFEDLKMKLVGKDYSDLSEIDNTYMIEKKVVLSGDIKEESIKLKELLIEALKDNNEKGFKSELMTTELFIWAYEVLEVTPPSLMSYSESEDLVISKYNFEDGNNRVLDIGHSVLVKRDESSGFKAQKTSTNLDDVNEKVIKFVKLNGKVSEDELLSFFDDNIFYVIKVDSVTKGAKNPIRIQDIINEFASYESVDLMESIKNKQKFIININQDLLKEF